jgi:hypothetical protein
MMVAALKFVAVFLFLAFLAFSNYRTSRALLAAFLAIFSTGFYSFLSTGNCF